MAVRAPEPLRDKDPSAEVHWTTFPASSVAVNWTDPATAHRAVMRLFPAILPGERHQRRETSGILFRLDNIGGVLQVLVQSRRPPEVMPVAGDTMTVAGPGVDRGWRNGRGDSIALRVAINPVVRGKRTGGDRKKRDVVRGVVAPKDVAGWLDRRLAGAITDLWVLNHCRDTYGVRDQSTGREVRKLVIDTVDAVATVGDPDELDGLRRRGVGRSKAYGCGLMTARRAVPE